MRSPVDLLVPAPIAAIVHHRYLFVARRSRREWRYDRRKLPNGPYAALTFYRPVEL
jgi:hypothetical protein